MKLFQFFCAGLAFFSISSVADSIEYHSGTISARATWSSANIHIVQSDVTVSSGVELVIEAGAIVKFTPNSRLVINGALNAVGSESERIYFTSYRDDSLGGDSNGDGYSEGRAGDWNGLYFSDTVADSLTRLSFIEQRFAGRSNTSAISMNGANIYIGDAVIRDSAAKGIEFANASGVVERSRIDAVANDGIRVNYGSNPLLKDNIISYAGAQGIRVESSNSAPELVGNRIEHSGDWGIYFRYTVTGPVLKGNSLQNNRRPLQVPVSMMPNEADGNVLLPNESNTVLLLGQNLSRELTLGVQSHEGQQLNAYAVSGQLTVNNGNVLTVAPGVALKFLSGASLAVNGQLLSEGTAAQPIYYTSYADDSVGGDSNLDGYNSSAAAGDWQGIRFNDAAPDNQSRFTHVKVRYAGQGESEGLTFSRTHQTLSDIEVSNSDGTGLYSYYSNVLLERASLFANKRNGLSGNGAGITGQGVSIYLNGQHGVYGNSGSIVLDGGEIFANGGYGAFGEGNTTVELDDFWWGAGDGPGGEGSGSGDEINAVVSAGAVRGDGTEYAYFDAGGSDSFGGLAQVTATKGTASSEWGAKPRERILFDLDAVELLLEGLVPNQAYTLDVTYQNKDVVASGCQDCLNRQHLEDGQGNILQPAKVSPARATTYRYSLPEASITEGKATLKFVRDGGYRVTIAEVMLTKQQALGGFEQNVSITSPQAGAFVGQAKSIVRGQARDLYPDSSMVELGVRRQGDNAFSWAPAGNWSNGGDWDYAWSLPVDGVYELQARVRNAESTVYSEQIAVTVDQTAPSAVSFVSGADVANDNGNAISVEWGGSPSADIAQYSVERREGVGQFTEIAQLGAGVLTFVDTGVMPGIGYVYRVFARDRAGNRSDGVSSVEVFAKDNAGDNQAPEDISNLKLTRGDSEVYLSWQASPDSDNDLIGYVLDVSADDGASWGQVPPAFNDGGSVSLGRQFTDYLVDGLTNGQVYRFRIRAQDGAGNLSAGVVSAAVSPSANAVTVVSGTLGEDTSWRTGVYHVSGDVTIPTGKTLTIHPGVVVKLGLGRRITIAGQLQSLGTESSPVHITSFTDDSVGGDSNGDGAATAGEAGYWDSLYVQSSASMSLQHTHVRFGGRNASYGIFVANQGVLALSHSEVNDHKGQGIYLQYGNLTGSHNRIHHNSANGIYASHSAYQLELHLSDSYIGQNGEHGLKLTSSTYDVVLTGNTFEGNGQYGIFADTAPRGFTFVNNRILQNGSAVRLPFSALPGVDDGNEFVGNQRQEIELVGSELRRNVKTAERQTYRLVSGTGTVVAGSLLNLGRGNIWKFNPDTSLTINGALNAVGSESERIYFTSYRDDSLGGDSNGDGYSEGRAGDWNGLYFSDTVADSLTRLSFIEQRFAGRSNTSAISMNGANIYIGDAVIRDSAAKGIEFANASGVVERSRIDAVANDGIRVNNGSNPLLKDNVISHAGTQGIRVESSNSAPELVGNRIEHSGDWGIYFRYTVTGPVLKGNILQNNRRALQVPVSMMPNEVDGNVLLPNESNTVLLLGQNLSRELTLGVQSYEGQQLNAYAVSGQLTVNNGNVLTVAPGVALKFLSGASLAVNGQLLSEGTAAQPIYYTSYADDSVGGDSNLDGYNSSAAAGDWQGIRFNDAAPDNQSRFTHVKVRYAGQGESEGLTFSRTHQTLSDIEVSNSDGTGLYSYYSNVLLERASLFANKRNGLSGNGAGITGQGVSIYLNGQHGVYGNSGSIVLDGGEIFANGGYGAFGEGNTTVELDDFWWGAGDGPGGEGSGSGDEINAVVSAGAVRGDGTEYAYFDAGGSGSFGGLAQVTATKGTASSEWGAKPRERILFDLDAVELLLEGLVPNQAYTLDVTYQNKDVVASGCQDCLNRQHLEDGQGNILQSAKVSPARATTYRYSLPEASITEGKATLKFVRDGGYRVTIAEVLLTKQQALGGFEQNVSITSPQAGAFVGQAKSIVRGQARDLYPDSSMVELGVRRQGDNAFSWAPAGNWSNGGDWDYVWSLPVDGVYELQARVRNAESTVYSEQIAVTVDQTAPSAVSFVSGADVANDNGNAISVEWGGSPSADIAQYSVERREGVGQFTEIAQLGAGVLTFVDTGVMPGIGYVYRVFARDRAGNRSDGVSSVEVFAKDNAGDNQAPEDISNLKLTRGDSEVYLSWQASPDSDNDLIGYVLDVSADDGASWGQVPPAFNDGGSVSLGRQFTDYLVDGLTNGQVYRFRIRAQDGAGNLSAGVVSAAVSPSANAVTVVSGTLGEDTSWRTGVYHVSGDVTIPTGKTLTIHPGVVVKLGLGRRITIAGQLQSLGTESSPVHITSFTDDSVGGDSNGDGAATAGEAGYWDSLYVQSSASMSLQHTHVRFGGRNASYGIFVANQGVLALSHSEVNDHKGQGIYLQYGNLTGSHNRIHHNSANGIYASHSAYQLELHLSDSYIGQNGEHGLKLTSSTYDVVLTGNTFEGNGQYGIFADTAPRGFTFVNNRILQNGSAVRLPFSALPGVDDGNEFVGNQRQEIELVGSELRRNVKTAERQTYRLVSGTGTVVAGSLLNLGRGNIWKFNPDTSLTINGALNAVGSESERIYFTSYRDDSLGGDSNGDGYSEGRAGDWNGLYFSDTVADSLTRLSFIEQRFAGRSNTSAISMNGANIYIGDAVIRDSAAKGIEFANASGVVERSRIDAVANDGIRVNNGSNPLLKDNVISHAGTQGIRVESSNSAPELVGNRIEHSGGWGIYFRYAVTGPVLKGNSLQNNRRPLQVPVSMMPNEVDGNVLLPNESNTVLLLGQNLSRELTLGVQSHEGQQLNAYAVSGQLTVNNGNVLTVAPGVALKFLSGASLAVNGQLLSEGTAAQPIYYTSYADDSVGGDSNLDGYNSSAAAGDWQGIRFNDAAPDNQSRFTHVKVRYAGQGESEGLTFSRTHQTLSDIEVSNSDGTGLYSYYSNVLLERASLFANKRNGLSGNGAGITGQGVSIYLNGQHGVYGNSGSIVLDGGEIFANGGYGAFGEGNTTVELDDFWWGAGDGPGGEGSGSGDEINAVVSVGAVRGDGTEYAYFDAGGSVSSNYALSLPIVSGEPSSQWGTKPYQSANWEPSGRDIRFEFTGLESNSYYSLITGFYNPTEANVTQSVIANELSLIQLKLDKGRRYVGQVMISPEMITDGNFTGLVRVQNGVVNHISELVLVKADTISAETYITLSHDSNGVVGGSGVNLSGGFEADSHQVNIDLGITSPDGSTTWERVNNVGDSHWSKLWKPQASGNHKLRARLSDADGRTVYSELVELVADLVVPHEIKDLRVFNQSGSILLKWSAGSPDISSQEIFRAEFGNSPVILSKLTGESSSFIDSAVVDGSYYSYFVRTFNNKGNYSDSNVVGPIRYVENPELTQPDNVSQHSVQYSYDIDSKSAVFVSWYPLPSTSGISEYRILIKDANSDALVSEKAVTATRSNVVFSELEENVEYLVSIISVDINGHESSGVSQNIKIIPFEVKAIQIGGQIVGDWVIDAGVYHISNDLIVKDNQYLDVSGDVVFKALAGKQIRIDGKFNVNSKSEVGVIFTSIKDDVKGDTNKDGQSSPAKGDWAGIYANRAESFNLNDSLVKHAGWNDYSVYSYYTNASLTGFKLSSGKGKGIYTVGGSLDLNNSSVVDVTDYAVHSNSNQVVSVSGSVISDNGGGLYIGNATQSYVLDNNIHHNSGFGIYYNSSVSAGELKNNTIVDNAKSFQIPASLFPDESNLIYPNTDATFHLLGGDLPKSTRMRGFASPQGNTNTVYVTHGDLYVRELSKLSIDPGVVVKFNGNRSIYLKGIADITGEVLSPIVFTSYKDDVHGGDSNADASTSTPGRGDWGGLRIESGLYTGLSKLDNISVLYAGSNQAAVLFDGANISYDVSGLDVFNSAAHGLLIRNSAKPVISGSNIVDNFGAGVSYESYAAGEINFSNIFSNGEFGVITKGNASPKIGNSRFFANNKGQLQNQSQVNVLAQSNWWGDFDGTGPLTDASPDASGGRVLGSVSVDGYLPALSQHLLNTNFEADSIIFSGNLPEPEILRGVLSNEWDPVTKHPGKTALVDSHEVGLGLSGLDPSKRYELGLTLFNGDVSETLAGVSFEPVGEVLRARVSRAYPTKVYVEVPSSAYHDGNLLIKVSNLNPDTSFRVAVAELSLTEVLADVTPPIFEELKFDDKDGSGGLTMGDSLYLLLSEEVTLAEGVELSVSSIVETDPLNSFGDGATLEFTDTNQGLKLKVGENSRLPDGAILSLKGLVDLAGYAVIGQQILSLIDTVPPTIDSFEWLDIDNSGQLTTGDIYKFTFSEPMNPEYLRDGTTDANSNLRVANGRKYGTRNTLLWGDNNKTVALTITDGFTVQGDELVTPTAFVQDLAGNPVVGQILLLGKDTIAPEISAVLYNDTDADGILSVGDWYRFNFSEPVNPSALSSGTSEANHNLSPEGKQYGDVNLIRCDATYDSCEVVITEGFTIDGNETVTPSSQLIDRSGNKFANTGKLTLIDTIVPKVIHTGASQDSPIDLDLVFSIRIVFDGSMDIESVPQITLSSDDGVQLFAVNGHWSQTYFDNDTYIFEVDGLSTDIIHPLNLLTQGAKDPYGNSFVQDGDIYSFSIRPDKPSLFGLKPYPQTNISSASVQMVEGERSGQVAIFMNGQKIVESGIGGWNHQIALSEGLSTLSFVAENARGVRSKEVLVNFLVDSTAPLVQTVSPANASYLRYAPDYISLNIKEDGSGLNIEGSVISLTRAGTVISGEKLQSSSGVNFIPSAVLVEGEYEIKATLADKLGHTSNEWVSIFTIDNTAPMTPVVLPVPEVTNIKTLQISGTKEAGTGIVLEGQSVVAASSDTSWQASWTLHAGENLIKVQSVDYAGNLSPIVIVRVTFDDSLPGKVVPTVTSQLSGTGINIDWSNYDEQANGADIDRYRVYLAQAPYSNASQAQLIGITHSPVRYFEKSGLDRSTTYYVAVQAVDLAGNADPELAPVAVQLADTLPPGDVTGLQLVNSGYTSLDLGWRLPSSEADDLGGFKVYLNEQLLATLPSTAVSYKLEGLSKATSYKARVASFDVGGNESVGVEKSVVTLLDAPSITQVEALSGKALLKWQNTSVGLISGFRLYASETPFSSINGMTPRLSVSGVQESATVGGLTNGITYYVAVSVVNTSGGQTPDVQAVTVKPVADATGPDVVKVNWGSNELVGGGETTISTDGILKTTAQDESGVSLVEYWLDGQLFGRSANNSSSFAVEAPIAQISDGQHALVVKAFDSLDNYTEVAFSVNVAMEAPSTPVIVSPVSGYKTNKAAQSVTITAESGTDVQLVYNGEATDWLSVDVSGKALHEVILVEGENQLHAVAKNRGGQSSPSATISVTLDSSLPQTPSGLNAIAKESGYIALSWLSSNTTESVSYNLYRANSAFSDTSAATKVNAQPISALSYQDKPVADGEYFYRVVAVNALGTEGAPSEIVRAVSDATLPYATGIYYTPKGNKSSSGDIIGVGPLDIRVVVNEPLLTRPFLSLTPEGVAPLTVDLFKVSDLEYQGTVDVPENYVDTAVYALFSARDQVGNRGTEVNQGNIIQIDTQGPRAEQIVITPQSPIKNEGQDSVSLDFSFAFDEAVLTESLIVSILRLEDDPVELAGVYQNADGRWVASFQLPADWGRDQVELIDIAYTVSDELGNTREAKLFSKPLQVYQGDLPPLDVPFGLAAKVKPEGRVALSWHKVPEASGYQLYRRGVNETETTLLVALSDVDSYTDYTLNDDEYYYSIASVRTHEGLTSVSSPSQEVKVVSDSVAPVAPVELNAELYANGVGLRWKASPEANISYRVYRSDSTEILDVEGLSPVIDKIISLEALDTEPDPALAGYVVTAVDEAGNESTVSNTAYLNISLLPVNKVRLTQIDGEKPALSWEHKGSNIAGFDLHLLQDTLDLKLNETPLQEMSFVDDTYTSGARDYRILAIDNNGIESLAKEVHLPAVSLLLDEGVYLEKGVMNKLMFKVSNLEERPINSAKLKVQLAQREHASLPFSLAAGETKEVTVIIGGYSELDSLAQLIAAISVQPTVSDEIVVGKTFEISVRESGYLLTVETDGFIKGGSGKFRFKLENTSDVDVELETASGNGTRDARHIQFRLRDEDGNVLSLGTFRQSLGDNVVTTAAGITLARVAPGQSFVSDWAEIVVPMATPDIAELEVAIGQLSYQLGREQQVLLAGISTRKEVNTSASPYFGQVTGITPTISYGDQAISIQGQLVDRYTSAPVANAALELVLNLNGFEKIVALTSNAEGIFNHEYQPQAGESGHYQVSAIYPGMTDRPDHGQFSVGGINANYRTYQLSLPKGARFDVPASVSVRKGADFQGVVWELANLPPAGISIMLPEAKDLSSEQVFATPIGFEADESAVETGSVELQLKSASTGSKVLAKLTVNYRLSEAMPVLYYSPAQVETGMTLAGMANEVVQLENRGTLPMENLAVRLLNADNSLPPTWAKLSGNTSWPQLAVGDRVNVNLAFNPENRANPGVYRLKLRVTSANHPTRDIPVIASMVEDGIGGLQLKLADIYTATLNEQGELIRGLQGASLSLQNLDVPEVKYQATTDELGEIYYPGIQAGNYRYRISATKHEDLTGEIRILPGVVRNLDLFMKYALVTVEWVVNEITIEDRYEIILKGTFETDVPAAVVVMEPFSIRLPNMQKGDVYNGELTLTNYGLVRADNLKMRLPTSDEFFKYEFMTSVIPDSLEAKQSLVIPYRIISLQPFDPSGDGDASGGGCSTYGACASSSHSFVCPNGSTSSGSASACWTAGYCTNSGGGGGGGGGWGGGWGGGGSGGDGSGGSGNSGMGACRKDGDPCDQQSNGGGNDI
ncbi:right-handed parallel beta-helix repeat-containing protein [Shewanella khirikhana]|uniref:Exoglucanase B n=1 Tax=Shewanella khirikhana TaxID=1965282 RepID=A0ABN5U027_9GAMM|nr:right-handed parallel beta-helix repeat-containing protein [Shewanella khirikhana]AZQ13034.1 Exoglucanase B precursor [Shewanella khirikhana]